MKHETCGTASLSRQFLQTAAAVILNPDGHALIPPCLIPVGSHVAEELVAAIRYPTKPDTTMLPQAAR
jgi:hypothetical protein